MAFARGALFWSAAWFASAVLWIVLTDSVRIAELVAGAGVAAIAATAFEIVRRQRVVTQSLRPELVQRLWRVLVGIVPDVWRLTRAAFAQLVERRPARGLVLAVPFRHTDEDPDTRARRAVAVAFGSIAPNSIVIGVDHESGLLLVHQLEPTRKPDDLDPMGLR